MLHQNESTNMTFNVMLDDIFSDLKLIFWRKANITDVEVVDPVDAYQDLIAKYPFFSSLTDKDMFFILYLADYLYTNYKTSGNAMIYNIYKRFRHAFTTMQFHIIAVPHMQLNYNDYKFRLSCDDIYTDYIDHVEHGITKTSTFIYNGHEDTDPFLPPMTLNIHSFNISEIKEVIEPIFDRIGFDLFENIEERTNVYYKVIADMFVYLARELYDNITDNIYHTPDPTTNKTDQE